MSVLTAESLRPTFRMRPQAKQPCVSSGKKNPKGFWNTTKSLGREHFYVSRVQISGQFMVLSTNHTHGL
jgi:hypothetical protein